MITKRQHSKSRQPRQQLKPADAPIGMQGQHDGNASEKAIDGAKDAILRFGNQCIGQLARRTSNATDECRCAARRGKASVIEALTSATLLLVLRFQSTQIAMRKPATKKKLNTMPCRARLARR